ncbi:hypothetical protein QM012_009015 [Aureobasidium pullulans]|uniref:Uncharacterized protein n=1 Tax=Aureobasidium pullulans TaxID=5580 RepID=A0ABR0TJP2_AURPU
MTSLDPHTEELVDKAMSPKQFNENIFSQSLQGLVSPLKMHAVHIEHQPVPAGGDISLTSSPWQTTTPNATPVSQSSLNQLEPLQKIPATIVLEEQVTEDQGQQTPPPIPPKSPLRGAKKINWLSRLLSKTVGRLNCFREDSRKKAGTPKTSEQHKDPGTGTGFTSHKDSNVGGGHTNPQPTTIPSVGGVGDYGGCS